MKKDKRIKFEFTISGFIIGLILVAMFASTFFTFASQMEDSYNVTTPGGLSLKKYNATAKIIDEAEKIRQDVEIKEDVSAIDIIGGFFKSGFAALNTAANSFSLFNQLTNDAAQDVEALDLLKTYLQAIILIALFVGVLLSVLTKMRI